MMLFRKTFMMVWQVAALWLLWMQCCHGFVTVKRRPVDRYLLINEISSSTNRRLTLVLPASGSNDNSNAEEDDDAVSGGGDDGDIDVELERKRLESLLGITQTESSNDDDANNLLNLPLKEWKNQVKSPPLLTSIGRERMEMEITLLESLSESDDAIPELWNLWYNARGPEAAKELMQTEALVAQGQPEAWSQAEDMLKKLIAKEGIHWVEPVNRLATLMFLQSRHDESKELCEIVLELKPWHFGALSGMVMVCQGLQDTEGMLDYAKRRMPPLPKKGEENKETPKELDGEQLDTRQTWVYRMADRAKAMLLKLEMGLEESFLDLDDDKTKKTTTAKTSANATTTTSTGTNSTLADDQSSNVKSKSQSNVEKMEEYGEEEDAWQ